MEHTLMWRFRKPDGMKVVLVVLALLYSLYSLKSCRTCVFQRADSTNESTLEHIDFYGDDGGLAESEGTSSCSAGFLSPTTIHTINVEDGDGSVNCRATCSLGLQHACSEVGRRECPVSLRSRAKASVAYNDLPVGDYLLTVNCADSERSCYADPQNYSFHVEAEHEDSIGQLKHIPVVTIKLLRKLTDRCSREQIWRSRITCLGILYTVMGVGLLIISHTERFDHERPLFRHSDDIRWVLQSRSRAS